MGPWVFGVAMFTVMIMAGSFLFEFTKYLTEGIPPGDVLQLAGLVMPGIMAKTFPMAVLLAGLLAFGRLSSDSEIVAIKAAGTSVARIMLPVAAFGFVVTVMTFIIDEQFVPNATRQAVDLRSRIDNKLNGRAAQDVSHAEYDSKSGKLVASYWAKDFNFTNRTLKGVIITVYDNNEMPTVYFHVKEMAFTSAQDWAMQGVSLTAAKKPGSEGQIFSKIDALSPADAPHLTATPEELLAKILHDLDALPMVVMGEQIEKLKNAPVQTTNLREQVANLEYGYWNKVALPLAALIFGLVGAPLGIRSHRVPASAGYWIAVIIIVAYLVLSRVMAIAAQGGRFPAFAASFLPIAIGLVVAGVLIRKRD